MLSSTSSVANKLAFHQLWATGRVVVVSDGDIVSDSVDRDLVSLRLDNSMDGLTVNIMQQMDGMFTDLNIWNYTMDSKYVYVLSFYPKPWFLKKIMFI
jgi:hypothetical protein